MSLLKDSELYLILSDKCNFSCSHCINSSSPTSSRYNMTEKEILQVINFINDNHQIKELHFSGGEPTLHIPLIQRIQNNISREIKYSITTNGWFGNNPENIFKKIKIDRIVISYDRFRKKFVKTETLQNLIKFCSEMNMTTSVSLVCHTLDDFLLAKDLTFPNVKFIISNLIQGGRQQSLPDENNVLGQMDILDSTCPSIDRLESDLEKIVYIPGRGLTPCCGPLAFDEMLANDFTFSKLENDYSQNLLRKSLCQSNFVSKLESKSMDTNYRNSCSACVAYYKNQFPSVLKKETKCVKKYA